ncbi:type 1 glutamine amidotransferase [Amycolatopsis benzoatilytica]|uniref:type 1 glutamine amidotransferase n=1 Tax=Amycolatopsis benzoatilytica TaxID=346045 RepID=UPI000369B996|nr:hypothetical protein [Amycolatopsis benzoatilytica]
MSESTVRIGLVLPDILGTYGDGGNAVVLAQRLRWRGIPAEVTSIDHRTPVPASLDVYLLGGGEDDPQELAAKHLLADGGLHRAAARGATVLGVCAGLQLLGTDFTAVGGCRHPGLELLDLTSAPAERRAVGEIVVEPPACARLETLTGFENHRGSTRLGPGCRPLGTVTAGVGNGDGTDGAVAGRIAATYLHGPVLARNPAFADLLLGWALGTPLEPLDLPEVTTLRTERLRAARAATSRFAGWPWRRSGRR